MLLSLGLGVALWLLTVLLTWGWIKLAQSRQIHDQPERRRLHQTQVPRAGGISIALVMILITWAICFISLPDASWMPVIAAAITMFGALGFWDDLKPISPVKKLLLHLLAATLILIICIFSMQVFFFVSALVALTFLLSVNIWNFMDGSNGMVVTQSLLYVIGFILLSYFSSHTYYYALILAVCCLGFLPFNFPVARVFLGDVGSHILGAAVAGLAILSYAEYQWTILEILCLFSVLWIDAGLTLIRRSFRGFKITQAHRSHLYQYAIRAGKTHVSVCCYYALWTISVILLIGFSRQLQELGQRNLLVGVIIFGCALHQSLRLFVLKSVRIQKAMN